MSHSENHTDTGNTTAYYQGVSEGKALEQKRIIKIIQDRLDYACRCRCKCHADPPPCLACQADGELIEIIKGEQK